LQGISALDDSNQHDNHGDDEQQVDQGSSHWYHERSEQPEYEQDEDNC
jgi:hypothetical protein